MNRHLKKDIANTTRKRFFTRYCEINNVKVRRVVYEDYSAKEKGNYTCGWHGGMMMAAEKPGPVGSDPCFTQMGPIQP